MKRIILSGAAADLAEAAAYYESEKPALGTRFLNTFEAAVREILIAPKMYPPLGDRFRKYGLRPFPYAVIYRQEKDTLVIVAVMHQKRRPGYWRDRIG